MTDLTQNPAGKYNGNEARYVLQALDSDNLDNKKRPWVQRFEAEFCRVMGVKYAIACNSGTSALHAALAGAGVGPGDEVISPGLTVIMDAYATIHVGAKPVFADVNPKTHTIDAEDVARKINSKTKAIIVVSLQGLSVDMDPIMELARKHNLLVIEDSAQTVLGKYNGKIAGTIGHIGCWSFENKKHMTAGSEGGMITTNDETLATKIRKFAGIGYKHLTAGAGRTSLTPSEFQNPEYERFDTVGLNYRMAEINAAVGLAQLERVEALVARRQAVGKMFLKAIEGCPWMVPQETPANMVHSYYTFAVSYFGKEQRGLAWREFYQKYRDLGGDGFYGACKVPYLEPVFKNLEIQGTRYGAGLCPKAEDVQSRVMQFKTNYRDLKVAEQKAQILAELVHALR